MIGSRKCLRITAAVIAAALAALALPAFASAAPSTTVVLTFDDGLSDQYANALPALTAHGLNGTFYVNSGHIGSGGFMSWAQVQSLAAAGNEIGGHTIDHANLTLLTPAEASREICNDRVNLINEGLSPTDFAYPYGASNASVRAAVSSCGYNSARLVGGIVSPSDGACASGCPYAESIPPANPYAVRTPDSIVTTNTVADLQTLVTQAESNGGGLVPIVFHDICDNACSARSITPANFNSFLDWLSQQAAGGAIAVQTMQQVISGSFRPGVPGPPPTGTTLQNPSLETNTGGGAIPDCWQAGGYGANTPAFSQTSNAHSGSWAEQLTLTGHQSGDAKLVVTQDQGQCAPAASPGRAYTLSTWFKSTTSMSLIAYYRDQFGAWRSLASSPSFPAASSWTQAVWTTPVLPSTATAISFGPRLTSNGSITVDDLGLAMASVSVSLTSMTTGNVYSGVQTLTANAGTGTDHVDFLVNGTVVGTAYASPYSVSWDSASVPDGPVTVTARAVDASGASSSSSVNVSIDNSDGVKNASLEFVSGSGSVADCWTAAGYGTNTFAWSRTGNAHTGSWAERLDITSLTSGDRKLLQTMDSGLCAPAVQPGTTPTISAWFESTAAPYFVVYVRNSLGAWSFWTSSRGFAGSPASWTQASWKLPAIPAGTTNISFGLDLNVVGSLTVDDFGLSLS